MSSELASDMPGRAAFEDDPSLIKSYPSALNNFHCVCPGGLNRKREAAIETVQQHLERMKMTFREYYAGCSFAVDTSMYTEMYLDNTHEEFYMAIDSAIEAVGLTTEEVKALNDEIDSLNSKYMDAINGRLSEQRANETSKGVVALARERNRMLVPVYLKLREMEYNHEDLIR